MKRLFSIFKDKRILFKQEEFGKQNDWLSVLNTQMNKLKHEIDSYGLKKVAQVDKDADDKFISGLENGVLKPYNDTNDLHQCIVALLGQVLGFRGGKEIVKANWSDFEFRGPTNKLPAPCLYARPGEGWDKTNQLTISHNVYIRNNCLHVAEDKENQWCLCKLMKHYHTMCDPQQERLFCYSNQNQTHLDKWTINKNRVLGCNTISQYGKNVAELCGFIDYKAFALHRFCRLHVSNNVNNNAPTYERRKHSRHAPQLEAPYVTTKKHVAQEY